jgi:endoglucanase
MRFLLAALAVILAASTAIAADDAFAYNRRLGRGINLGGALEGPVEGEWGVTLNEGYFKTIKEAGFDSVRIPVRWGSHDPKKEPPFTIDPVFFARVDWAIKQALSHGLLAVIDIHHDDVFFKDPEKSLPRLKAYWKQIALRYRNQPDTLSFELLNEPFGKLTDELWNQMIPQLLAVVRESNPKRIVIVGPGHWNNISELDKLSLPEDDRRLIATVHYYTPMSFTHQGASWVTGSAQWLGNVWTGSPQELALMRKDFDKAAAWGQAHGRPMFLGEFGSFSAGDMESRVRWTRAVAAQASTHGMSSAYWEFCSTFGAYDPKANAWRRPLLDALINARP